MCIQYIWGCSVHRGRGVQYIRGIPWVHRGYIMSTLGVFSTSGDIMSTFGDVQYIGGYHDACGGYHEYPIGGYHEYIGGISWVHRGMFSTSGFSIERFLPTCSPTCIMISPQCTEHPPMYSWYPPDVLMVSPGVLNVPWCTHDIPPHASWYPPDVLMISPDVLMVSPDVLNIPRCTEHRLYRVIQSNSSPLDKFGNLCYLLYPINLMLSSPIFILWNIKIFLESGNTGVICRLNMHLSIQNAWKWDMIEFIRYLTRVCLFWSSVLHCFNSCTPGIISGPISSRCVGLASRWNYNGEL